MMLTGPCFHLAKRRTVCCAVMSKYLNAAFLPGEMFCHPGIPQTFAGLWFNCKYSALLRVITLTANSHIPASVHLQ